MTRGKAWLVSPLLLLVAACEPNETAKSSLAVIGDVPTQGSAADAEPETGAFVAEAENLEETSRPPSTRGAAPLSVKSQVFIDAHVDTLRSLVAMAETLRSMQDANAAASLGAKLRMQAKEFVRRGEKSSRLFALLYNSSEGDRAVSLAYRQADDLFKNSALDDGDDLIELIAKAAEGPGGDAVRDDLRFVRDTLLGTRGIHVPVLTRRRIAEELGSSGSALRTP